MNEVQNETDIEVKDSSKEVDELVAEKNKIWIWVKKNWKQLVAVGGSLLAILAMILAIKNRQEIEELWSTLKGMISNKNSIDSHTITAKETTELITEQNAIPRNYTLPKEKVDVTMHIRNMAMNKHHSPDKALQAAECGITLLPNQTIVDQYTKYAS